MSYLNHFGCQEIVTQRKPLLINPKQRLSMSFSVGNYTGTSLKCDISIIILSVISTTNHVLSTVSVSMFEQ